MLDSENTYVNDETAYVYRQIRGDLLTKCKQTLLNCHAMLPVDVANVIIPVHEITGTDYTPGFYGHGEKPLLQHLMTNPEEREPSGRAGESRVNGWSGGWYKKPVFFPNYMVNIQFSFVGKWQKLNSRYQSASHLMMEHWTIILIGQITSRISSCILLSWNVIILDPPTHDSGTLGH